MNQNFVKYLIIQSALLAYLLLDRLLSKQLMLLGNQIVQGINPQQHTKQTIFLQIVADFGDSWMAFTILFVLYSFYPNKIYTVSLLVYYAAS